MTVKLETPKSFDDALGILQELSDKYPSTEFIFRGHSDIKYRLETSYYRYCNGNPLYQEFFGEIDRMVSQFRSGVKKLSLSIPLEGNLEWLEYGRHHGLPAPLLDFTWSPLIALFFAFDGVRSKDEKSSVVYCLNLRQLAKEIARSSINDKNPKEFGREIEVFLHEGSSHVKDNFPSDELFFIRYPNAHTRRMHVQQGTFIYSTLSSELEDYFANIEEGFDSPMLPNTKDPVLIKIELPHNWIKNVFKRLEICGILASNMYLSAEGVAGDVINSYNYFPRTAFLREEM